MIGQVVYQAMQKLFKLTNNLLKRNVLSDSIKLRTFLFFIKNFSKLIYYRSFTKRLQKYLNSLKL